MIKLFLQSIFNRKKYMEELKRFNPVICQDCGDILIYKDEIKARICRGCISLLDKAH